MGVKWMMRARQFWNSGRTLGRTPSSSLYCPIPDCTTIIFVKTPMPTIRMKLTHGFIFPSSVFQKGSDDGAMLVFFGTRGSLAFSAAFLSFTLADPIPDEHD